MKKSIITKRIVSVIAIITVSAFVLVGCGENKSSDSTSTKEQFGTIKMGIMSIDTMDADEFSERITDHQNKISEEYGAQKIANEFSYYDSLDKALLALNKGDIELMILPEATANYVMAQNNGKYAIHTSLKDGNHEEALATIEYNEEAGTRLNSLTDIYLSMATLSNNTELQTILNNAIATLETKGTLTELENQYIKSSDIPAPTELPVIEGAKTYKVAVTGDIPPIDYVTADGKAAGYNIALLSAISKEANINFELIPCDTGARVLQLTSGKSDIVFWVRTSFSGYSDMPESIAITSPYMNQHRVKLELVK